MIGTFLLIGFRRFGQVWAQHTDTSWDITVFDGPNAGCDRIVATDDIVEANTLTPTTPPTGFTGYQDKVNFTPTMPLLANWSQASEPAITLGYFFHTESSTNYWLLALVGLRGFVLATTNEVTLECQT